MSSASGGDSDVDGGGSSDGGGGDGDDVHDLLPATIDGLNSSEDPSIQITFLTSFCNVLAFVEYAEDLDGLPLDEIVPLLVKLVGRAGNPHVMLMSARVLTYFLDLMPRSAKLLVKHGAIEALCMPVTEIEYLDIAEQCLEALEKLSRRRPVECLKAGVINAVLSFIDFFEISVQRVAVSIVTNMCKKIPEDCCSAVMDALPILCNLLGYQDRKLVESAAICLMMIVESFSHSSGLLEDLCKNGVIKHSLNLISPGSQMALSRTTYTGIIGLLVHLASHSLHAVKTLYDLNINNILGSILRSAELSLCSPHSNCDDMSRDQIFITLKLLNQLIPPIPHEGQDNQLILGKQKIIVDEPKLSLQLATDILPALTKAVNSGANTCISYGCVSVIRNFVSVSTPEMMRMLINNANIPKFLPTLLSQTDHHVLIPALNIVEIIMKNLPGEYLNSFVKEGVSHAIRELSNQEDRSHYQLMDDQSTDDESEDLSRCFCYAFEPSSCLLSESKACRLQRHTVLPLAQSIISTFFTESLISDVVLSENLRKLKACCMLMDSKVDTTSTICAEKEGHLSQILDKVIAVLNEGESVSTFEFIESGFVRFLAHYLTNVHCLHSGQDEDNYLDLNPVVLNRLQTFTCLLFSGQRWQNFPLSLLVRHLQNALSTSERFPVVLSSKHSFTSKSTDIPAKSSTTHPCLQVHFVREEGETDLSRYDCVLTVEFSLSLDTIEAFLWSKVNKKTAVSKMTRAGKCRKKRSSGEVDSEKQVVSSSYESNEESIAPKLIFLLDGKQLDWSMTLYQAIVQHKINEDPDFTVTSKFWNEVHRVTFKRAKELKFRCPQISVDTYRSSSSWDAHRLSWKNSSFFSSMLLSELPCKLDKSNPCHDTLFILKILEGLNRFTFQLCSHERSISFAEGKLKSFDDLKVMGPSIPQTEFRSGKLTAKLEKQMHDCLALSAATMPLWCTQLVVSCPFLFPFEVRWKYFCLNTLSISRNQIQNSRQNGMGVINDRRSLSASFPRKKFKVHRNNILGSAAKMMSWYARRKVLLEIEFRNEVGTGLGPTMEFYTLVSNELQKAGMGMWRGDHGSKLCSRTTRVVSDSDLVIAPSGLFPYPWADGIDTLNDISFSKVLKNFFLLGQLVARAIRDGRILDLLFSRAFYKLILEQDLDIYDISSFDPELGVTLIEFQALVRRKIFLESNSEQFTKEACDLSFRNTTIEDLSLDFTLSGFPDYVFPTRSETRTVNISNLEEYVSLVVDATLRSGISRQVQSFKSGFNTVFPIKALQIFTIEELERMLCGEGDTWNLSELQDHINFDHGYSSTSPPVMQFLEIIQEFDARQRKAFLLFVTGAPRLPPGGLAALKPKLTIVCKHCDNDADMELPSVMTCANYLKLPPYSSKERMREKLLYAITEGQGAFHLS